VCCFRCFHSYLCMCKLIQIKNSQQKMAKIDTDIDTHIHLTVKESVGKVQHQDIYV
jgi:hypothetical protein